MVVGGPRGGVILKASQHREDPPVSETALLALAATCLVLMFAVAHEWDTERMAETFAGLPNRLMKGGRADETLL